MKYLVLALLLLASPTWAMDQDQFRGRDRRGVVQNIHTSYYPDPSWPAAVPGAKYGAPIYPIGQDPYNPSAIVTVIGSTPETSRIACYSASTGVLLWTKDLRAGAYLGWNWVFGVAQGDKVIAAALDRYSFQAPLYALRQSDGFEVWKTGESFILGLDVYTDLPTNRYPEILWDDTALYAMRFVAPSGLYKIDLFSGTKVDSLAYAYPTSGYSHRMMMMGYDPVGVLKGLFLQVREWGEPQANYERIDQIDTDDMTLIAKSPVVPALDDDMLFAFDGASGLLYTRRDQFLVETWRRVRETEWDLWYSKSRHNWQVGFEVPPIVVEVFNLEAPGMRRALLDLTALYPPETQTKYALYATEAEDSLIATEAINFNGAPIDGDIFQDRNGRLAMFFAYPTVVPGGNTWWYLTVFDSRDQYFKKVYDSGIRLFESPSATRGSGRYTDPYWTANHLYLNMDSKIYRFGNRDPRRPGGGKNLLN